MDEEDLDSIINFLNDKSINTILLPLSNNNKK